MKKILLLGIFLLISSNCFANYDDATDMQTLTVSSAFTQVQNNFKALSGTSGTQPAKISVGATGVELEGSVADAFETVVTATNPTADRTQTLQDNSGIVPLGTAGNTLVFTTTGATNVTLPTSGTLISTAMQYTDTRFKVGSFSRDTAAASGTQTITGLGFSPKAVIFLAVQGAGETSWGFDTQGARLGINDIHQISANAFTDISSSIYLRESAGNDYSGQISSLDSDGFTMTWTKTGAPTGTMGVIYLALR